MGLIVDTCVWLGFVAGEVSSQAIGEVAGTDAVFISAVSLGELHLGVCGCRDPAERAERAAILRQLELRPVVAITARTATAFGWLAASVKQSGRSPRPRYNDLWIAASAIEHGHTLLTRNGSDFLDLPGLKLAIV